MKKLFTLAFFALTLTAILVSCDKDEEKVPNFEKLISEKDVKATPNPLTVVNNTIPLFIQVTIPAKFMPSKALLTLTPVLTYMNEDKGVETKGVACTYQGDQIQGTNEVISHDNGGKISLEDTFAYLPAMNTCKLYLEFNMLYKNQLTTFRIKCGDGVVGGTL